jgi:hypothetical protein
MNSDYRGTFIFKDVRDTLAYEEVQGKKQFVDY